jgi:hypothetical protein
MFSTSKMSSPAVTFGQGGMFGQAVGVASGFAFEHNPYDVSLREVEDAIRNLLDPDPEMVKESLESISIDTLAAIGRVGNLQYAQQFIPQIEQTTLSNGKPFDWMNVPSEIHPLSVGLEYGHTMFASFFLTLPTNNEVMEAAIYWAILRAPHMLSNLLARIPEDILFESLTEKEVKLALVKNPAALAYIDPFILKRDFLVDVEDPEVLEYLRRKGISE